MNISAKTKIFLKIFKGVNLGSRYYGFMKKPRLQKYHATVPLSSIQPQLEQEDCCFGPYLQSGILLFVSSRKEGWGWECKADIFMGGEGAGHFSAVEIICNWHPQP